MHLISWHNICSPKQKGRLRIISLFDKRQALFDKLAAQLVLDLTSFWAQIVASKYKFLGYWHNYRKHPKSSHTQNKIILHGQKINYNFIKTIGSGKEISIFEDPQISMVPLAAWPTFINMDMLFQGWKVNKLITADKSWNFGLLHKLFSKEMTNHILSIQVSMGKWKDQLTWGSIGKNKVAQKDMYNHFSKPMQHNHTFFTWLQKLDTTMRMKTFWWKLLRQKLPCKQFLCDKGILTQEQIFYDI